jgi:hypothetical protein
MLRARLPVAGHDCRSSPATAAAAASQVYAVLCHVLLIVQRAPIIFEGDHVSFYCRWAVGAGVSGVRGSGGAGRGSACQGTAPGGSSSPARGCAVLSSAVLRCAVACT